MSDRILRMRDLPALVGIERTAILQAVKKGKFPQPLVLTDSKNAARGWLESEIQKWIAERTAERDEVLAREHTKPRRTR